MSEESLKDLFDFLKQEFKKMPSVKVERVGKNKFEVSENAVAILDFYKRTIEKLFLIVDEMFKVFDGVDARER